MNSQKPQNIFEAKTYTGIRQDKNAQERISAGLKEPVRADTPAHKPQKHGSNKRQTVEVAGYVMPSIRAELERIAQTEGLSLSKVVATLLTQSIQTYKDMQYRSMLEPVIKEQIRQGIASYSNRTAILLIKNHRSAEQARLIAIRLLSLLLNGNQDIISRIVEEARIEAQANVLRHLEEDKENQN